MKRDLKVTVDKQLKMNVPCDAVANVGNVMCVYISRTSFNRAWKLYFQYLKASLRSLLTTSIQLWPLAFTQDFTNWKDSKRTKLTGKSAT